MERLKDTLNSKGKSPLDSPGTDRETLQAFVTDNIADGSHVFTDEHRSYRGMPNVEHESIHHSASEKVGSKFTPMALRALGLCSNSGTQALVIT